jgi:hypothetical protein
LLLKSEKRPPYKLKEEDSKYGGHIPTGAFVPAGMFGGAHPMQRTMCGCH